MTNRNVCQSAEKEERLWQQDINVNASQREVKDIIWVVMNNKEQEKEIVKRHI